VMQSGSVSGQVVFEDGVRPATIVLDMDKQSMESITEGVTEQPGSLLVFPGFIDVHVHAREYPPPGENDPHAVQKWYSILRKETFQSAGRAAINGGVTLIAAMPNDPVPPENQERYSSKQSISHSSPCPVVLFASVTVESEPWADLPYKVYLDAKPSPVNFTEWKDLETALARYKGLRVFFHAEDPEVLRKFQDGAPRWKNRPAKAETVAVEKILELTAKFALRTHVCHVSTEKSVLLIQDYNRLAGVPVTCEVTPHHLFFSVEGGRIECPDGRTAPMSDFLECNPPLRGEGDRRFMLHALKEGLVDMLASDHAPHTVEDKLGGAPGMPHLDTLGAFAGWLMQASGFSPPRIAEILSLAPARLIARELERPHGAVKPGAVASLTLLDLGRSTRVEGEHIEERGSLETLCRWSPFEGITLPASVRGTVIRGSQYLF
jgi:dihydroorotase